MLSKRNLAIAGAAGAVGYGVHLVRELEKTRAAVKRSLKLSPLDVVVIGAGFSGLCAGVKLQEAGIPFVILEKDNGVGGTWYSNRYPDAACDIPAHLYSFSFERNMDWEEPYAKQPEILAYLERVTDKYGLRKRLRLGCAVVRCEWQDASERWLVVCADGSEYRPRFVINGIGALHHPKYPTGVSGIETFAGESMHSSQWRDDVELKGKRVAVVGSAASAVQLIPKVAEVAKEVIVLQRTPNWVLPRYAPLLPRERYSETIKWLFRTIPGLELLHRYQLYCLFESTFWPLGLFDAQSSVQKLARKLFTASMSKSLGNDPKLCETAIPKFGVGCKRLCRTDKYLQSLTRENVTLRPHGLQAVEPDGIIDSAGTKHQVDVVIYATGFEVGSVGHLRFLGRGNEGIAGNSMADNASEAYLGTSMPRFPNAFTLLGANTGLGHNSVVLMIESQVEYVVRMISEAVDQEVSSFEIKPQVVKSYYDELWGKFDKRVWKAGGCQSWYQNDQGKIFALWPDSTVSYFRKVANAPSLRDSYLCKFGKYSPVDNTCGVSSTSQNCQESTYE